MSDAVSAAAVYRAYTQAELDRAYNQRAWAPNADEVLARYAVAGERVRRALTHRARVPYGDHPDETLDVFPAAGNNAPIHVHVHGGGWRHLTSDDVSFLAPAFLALGVTLIVLNFAALPATRMPVMIDQVRRAVAWIAAHAASFGGDAKNMHVSGHSSGGHVAGVLMTTDWSAYGLPAGVLKSGMLMSGMYDLEPVLLSARSSYVELTADESAELSSIQQLDLLCAPVAVIYGDRESPEFQRQACDFVAAAQLAGKRATVHCIAGVNHFELLGGLARVGSPVAAIAQRLIANGQSL